MPKNKSNTTTSVFSFENWLLCNDFNFVEKIVSTNQLIEVIAVKTAVIVFILSALHYINIMVITRYIKKLIK